MYKKKCLLLGILLAALAACSNDVEMPAQYHRDLFAQPTGVQVTVEDGSVNVSWQMDSADNVAGFVVRFTDASGGVETKSVTDPAARAYVDAGSLNVESGAVLQIHVWAVDAGDFFGPPSEPFVLAVP